METPVAHRSFVAGGSTRRSRVAVDQLLGEAARGFALRACQRGIDSRRVLRQAQELLVEIGVAHAHIIQEKADMLGGGRLYLHKREAFEALER